MLFIQLAECVLSELLSICVCASFPLGFEGGMWELIVFIPDHCLSFFTLKTLSSPDIPVKQA